MKLLNALARYIYRHLDFEKVNEKEIFEWLMDSYSNQGFKSYVSSEYARLTRYLASTYRGDEEYKKVTAQMAILRRLENAAKTAYTESQELINKEK